MVDMLVEELEKPEKMLEELKKGSEI